MRLSREQKIERNRQRKLAWQLELDRLYQRQTRASEPSPADLRRRHVGEEHYRIIWEVLNGREFALWIEATLSIDVEQWLDELRRKIENLRITSRSNDGFDELEFIKVQVEVVARRHRWTDPEQRAKWSAEVIAAADSDHRRAVLMRLATPQWADMEKVVAIYHERDRLVAETGIPHHVDHIYPLQSHEVCGLHCEFNLRVIPATENLSKNNRMPLT